MVTPKSIRRNNPEYSLQRIKELASKGKVHYGSKDVQRDITNLSYALSDVCDCLNSLEPDHYVESILYENVPSWLDVYLCSWQKEGGSVDPLYIKLKLDKNCITIVLASFHREGSL